jgi:hypothetical protein
MDPTTEGRDFEAGVRAGEQWIQGPHLDHLSEEQLRALPRNLARLDRLEYDRRATADAGTHAGGPEDPAADAYAALTGDLDCTGRGKVREFWGRVLPGDLGGYGGDFFQGFLHGVMRGVQ